MVTNIYKSSGIQSVGFSRENRLFTGESVMLHQARAAAPRVVVRVSFSLYREDKYVLLHFRLNITGTRKREMG